MTNQELNSAILSTLAMGSSFRGSFAENLAIALGLGNLDWRVNDRITDLMRETPNLRPVICRWSRASMAVVGVR
jgi:hypothetical protein